MIRIRKALGYETPDENIISINQQGFEFLGEPKTSLYHWNVLGGKLSTEEKISKRSE